MAAAEDNAMKIILAVVTMIALMGGPCYAQINAAPQGKTGAWSKGIDERKTKDTEEQKKKLEEAYQKAGKTIPEPKVKFDPWKNAR